MSTWERHGHGSRLRTQGLLCQVWQVHGDWHWQVRGMARATRLDAPFKDFGIKETSEEAEKAAVEAARVYLEAELVALMEAA